MMKNAKDTLMSTSSWAVDPKGPVSEFLATLELVDHHVHGVTKENPSE